MVSSIGAYTSGIFSYNSNLFSSGQAGASQSMSFDEMLSTGVVSDAEKSVPADALTSGGASGGGVSMGSKSEMDLNNDGQVTADEVIKYMQMQMIEKQSEQLSSEDGSSEMNRQAQQQFSNGLDDYKNKQAAGAYQSVQNSVIDMISESFMV